MKYFRVSKIDGRGFFTDHYDGDLFIVEYTQNEGEDWIRLSAHLSLEGAERKMRDCVELLPECELWEENKE